MQSIANEAHRGGRLIAEMIHEDLVVTTLTDTSSGYIIHDYPPESMPEYEDSPFIRGFFYSADLAAQRYFTLTGVDVSVEEMAEGSR